MGKHRVDRRRGRRADLVKSGRASRGARSSKNRPFYVTLGAIAVVGIALLGWSIARPTPGMQVTDVAATPAQAEGYLYGNPNAPVQILEFGDFECPLCGEFSLVTEPDVRKRILDTGLASLRYFDFPLYRIHNNTVAASNAAACADDQGKFWPMHDRLFHGQLEWNSEATDNPKKVFERYAKELGLDMKTWEQCFDQQKHMTRIMGNRAEALRRHINGTPTFIVGNKMIPHSPSYDELKQYVDMAAAQVASRRTAADSQAGKAAKP